MMEAFWVWVILSVIRIPINDSVVVLIPEDDRFEISLRVQVAETLWRDSVRFVYRYTIRNLPTSPLPLFRLGIGGYTPFGTVPWEIDSVWVNRPEMVRRNSGISAWGFSFFPPGETIEATVISPRMPDIVYWYGYGEDSVPIPTVLGAGEDAEEAVMIDSLLREMYFNKTLGKTPLGGGKYGYTVGMGPLPYPSLDSMVIHLQVRNDTAFALGWMSGRAHERLGRLLDQALRWAREERMDRFRATLERFLSTLERLHNQGEVQYEAYVVLFYRGRYVLNRVRFSEGPPWR